jgi:hypothetical protein
VNGLVGGNLYAAEMSDISGWGFNLSIPGFYRLSNFTTRERRHTLPSKRRILGAYTQWTFDYNEYAFLTLTGRNDWSSTLSLDDNAIFYPSASLALVFTDALGWSSSVLDYGKVRLSLAKVGADAPPYRLSSAYEVASLTDWSGGASTPVELGFPFRGVKGYLQSTERGNPDIKPESTVEAELGFELHWLGGRARTDISLYNRRSFDQIFSVPAAASTGFTSLTRNAGDLTNRGIEFSLGMTPIRTNDVLWDVRLNATRNWSKVDELSEEVDSIYLAGPGAPRQDYFLYLEAPDLPQVRIVSGESYGVIWGRGYQRNENGQLLIGADGFPLVEDDQLLGTISPTFLGNVNSSLRWRSLTLSGLFEIRRGGDIMNTDLLFTIPAGTAKITEQRNDSYVFDGVSAATGQPNTTPVIRDRDFWTRYANVHENLIESADVARLREATLAFRLPDAISGKLQAQSMSAFVTGRNLLIWAPFSYGDPDGSNYGAVNAGGSAYRFFTTPTTRTYTVGVRATF